MTRIYSKYKFFGGFGLLVGLNLLIGFCAFKLMTTSNLSYDKVDFLYDPKVLIAYSIIVGIFLLFMALFTTQCRYIIADKDGILFVNPIIPFFRTHKLWTDFDFYILVDESSRGGTHEAVWFIKNKKVRCRFSSFYYTNYIELKEQIRTEGKGKRYYGPFSQLFGLFGLIKIKN
jgi:hypothetical protein